MSSPQPDDGLLDRLGLSGAAPGGDPEPVPDSPTRARSRSRWFFGLVIACCLVVALTVTVLGAGRSRPRPASVPEPPLAAAGALPAMLGAPHVMFRVAGFGQTYGAIAVAPLSDPSGPRALTDLRCERVHVEAGVGVCLEAHPGIITTYSGSIFDAADPAFPRRATFPLTGIPSRVKLSSDGRLAGVTVFVSGHSYAGGQFSTQTTIVETATGRTLADLEDFEVWRDGSRIQAEDMNMWGVTFAGTGGRFFASLSHDGAVHLVEGDLEGRRLEVLLENVECPSISPDGTRLAFKKRLPVPPGTAPGTPLQWRFSVLDLATMTETPLAEPVSVDDQIEWLDDERVLYGKYDDELQVTNVWSMAADGTGQPVLVVAEGESPTVTGV